MYKNRGSTWRETLTVLHIYSFLPFSQSAGCLVGKSDLWESEVPWSCTWLCTVLEVLFGISADKRPLSQSDTQLVDPSSFLNLLANPGELWIYNVNNWWLLLRAESLLSIYTLESTIPCLLMIFLLGGSPHGRNSWRLYWSPSHPSSGCSQPNRYQRTKYHSIVCAGMLVLIEVF